MKKTMSTIPITKQQRGIVSIFTAMLLLIIVSLVVLGLAQISRREQRVSLDTQLSTQAFYAAESGVNDAIEAIRSQVSGSGGALPKTQCLTDPNYPTLTGNVINAAKNVAYTCLLINPKPSVLTSSLSSGPSVFALTPEHPSSLNQIILEWDSVAAGNFASCPNTLSVGTTNYFVARDNWQCNYGVVRIDLVPVASGSLNRTALQNNTYTLFFVPTQNGSSNPSYPAVMPDDARNGQIMAASCNNNNALATPPYHCTGTVNVPAGNYYMRATATYRTGFDLRVSANNAAGNFIGSQVIVDSTGKAQDVLRRILVNVDLKGDNSSVASAALMSGDSVCKRFSITEGNTITVDTSMVGDGGNPLCTP
ncbi:hypothetical protein KDA23_01635 [Candidatus Saccharibacteria bacterium]|nr:hypothetical protein [Candidatus Saccharibacteria bacterium]